MLEYVQLGALLETPGCDGVVASLVCSELLDARMLQCVRAWAGKASKGEILDLVAQAEGH